MQSIVFGILNFAGWFLLSSYVHDWHVWALTFVLQLLTLIYGLDKGRSML